MKSGATMDDKGGIMATPGFQWRHSDTAIDMCTPQNSFVSFDTQTSYRRLCAKVTWDPVTLT